MTNYDVYLKKKEGDYDMVAVFHRQGEETFELSLVPFRILAHSEVCTKYSPVAYS